MCCLSHDNKPRLRIVHISELSHISKLHLLTGVYIYIKIPARRLPGLAVFALFGTSSSKCAQNHCPAHKTTALHAKPQPRALEGAARAPARCPRALQVAAQALAQCPKALKIGIRAPARYPHGAQRGCLNPRSVPQGTQSDCSSPSSERQCAQNGCSSHRSVPQGGQGGC